MHDASCVLIHIGGAYPQTTNVFFSDFSDDPWQTASVNTTVCQHPAALSCPVLVSRVAYVLCMMCIIVITKFAIRVCEVRWMRSLYGLPFAKLNGPRTVGERAHTIRSIHCEMVIVITRPHTICLYRAHCLILLNTCYFWQHAAHAIYAPTITNEFEVQPCCTSRLNIV